MTTDLPAAATNIKPKRYHPALVVLHWIIAILIFGTAILAMGVKEKDAGVGEAR